MPSETVRAMVDEARALMRTGDVQEARDLFADALILWDTEDDDEG